MKNSLVAAIIFSVTVLGLVAGYLGGTVNSATTGISTTTITNIVTKPQTSLATTTVTTTNEVTLTKTSSVTNTVTTTNEVTLTKTSLATTTETKSVTTTVTQTRTHSESIVLAIEGYKGGRLGPDRKTHDTFIPSNFTVHVGVYNLTIMNYSIDPHTLTSTGLGASFQIPSAISEGVPSVTTFQLTATKPGVYRWSCFLPCDLDRSEWAMEPDVDGQIGMRGFMGGYVIVTS